MASTMDLAVVLYHDSAAIREAIDADAHPEAAAALAKYANLVRDVLVKLCGMKEYSHVAFLEKAESLESGDASTPFAVVVGKPSVTEDGELQGVDEAAHALDIMGALTASAQLPDLFTDKVGMDEDGVLGFADEAMAKTATKLNAKLGVDDLYADNVAEAEDEAVAEALSGLVPDEAELMPLHPEDLLSLLAVYVHTAAGPAPKGKRGGAGAGSSGPNLLGRVTGGVGAVVRAVGSLRYRGRNLRKAVWRLEDVAVGGAKLALRLARKAVRPALIALVLHRTLSTLEDSRTLEARMSRLRAGDALDLYLRELLGKDYGAQIRADLLAAAQDVEDGYLTDEYKQEKRKLTAAMVRRLEVEDWDKERMKHFYYGSYGLGPWYFDMEERLHNPFFIGGRAWNGPIEAWVGKNKTYPNDLPAEQYDWGSAALALVEADKGQPLSDAQRARILARERVRPVEELTRKGGLLEGVVDKSALVDRSALTAMRPAEACWVHGCRSVAPEERTAGRVEMLANAV
eukprot:CAMPEP_0202865700 /NCGR_PEP_ID=MMETSP1391-20130828/6304_1 /ASSEMBLY_ACC=CAM_ASM_000867 /TAXON_ID=1034604 /ORGANISM="Chlamydomonas leiostraca, Strain SAG 11-49" /LENGTH=514 /DNA_ID=CAMNT_0049545567 /DNA_START=40 /DNA_END=1585 /DNA_ORIENTATION=+